MREAITFMTGVALATVAPVAAQTGLIGLGDLPANLRAAGCAPGYWLETQNASGVDLPPTMLAQPGRRLVTRCVGLIVEAAPVCPMGGVRQPASGQDNCTGKVAIAAIKPIAPTCETGKLRIDAGAGGADLCVREDVALPTQTHLGTPWGFML